jgi:hypothetical protein
LQLHDCHNARRVGRMDDVPWINEAKAHFARERRTDSRIAELCLEVVDRRLVTFNLRNELIDRCVLCVELLARYRVLFRQSGLALQVDLCILQIRFILRLLR